jgi:hypothetical protein
MLTRTYGPLEQGAAYSSQRRDIVAFRPAAAYLAMTKRFCVSVLAVLAAGSAIAAIIALKAAFFLWVFHYY